MILGVSCPVFPTEEEERVISAVNGFFEKAEVIYRENEHVVFAEATERGVLESIRIVVHSMRIIDAVRAAILRNLIGLETRILIDKQAAYYRKFRLLDDREEEPPLGAIEIRICFEHQNEFDEFLKWFAPPTRNGKIVQSML